MRKRVKDCMQVQVDQACRQALSAWGQLVHDTHHVILTANRGVFLNISLIILLFPSGGAAFISTRPASVAACDEGGWLPPLLPLPVLLPLLLLPAGSSFGPETYL